MIRYSPGETRYDPSVGFLLSFKRLSLSDSLRFPWPPAEWGGDALRQRMMRCFPGETRHDPTVCIPTPLRGPGPGLRRRGELKTQELVHLVDKIARLQVHPSPCHL